MKISELFRIDVGKSKANDEYDEGIIPYVTSTTLNNGVLQFVEPYPDDKVFDGEIICISGLGFATLQLQRFLPKGNGGDSATLLIPLVAMTMSELVYYTATFNMLHNWRFSFGRKANKTRIKDLEMIPFTEYDGQFNIDFDDYMNLISNKVEEFKGIIS